MIKKDLAHAAKLSNQGSAQPQPAEATGIDTIGDRAEGPLFLAFYPLSGEKERGARAPVIITIAAACRM